MAQTYQKQKSFAGSDVTWEEMIRITTRSKEEKIYRAFGHFYPDFYEFYKSEFPNSYPNPRVRMSKKVRRFFELSRPKPIKIPLDDVKRKVEENLELDLYEVKRFLGKRLRIKMKEKEMPYIDLYPNRKVIVIYKAEILKDENVLVFMPLIANSAGSGFSRDCPEKILERKILKNLGLEDVKINFPEKIRVEHLIAYDGYPNREKKDSKGYPLWRLYEIPVARVSFISEFSISK
ncbi:MAG: hypothetical protein QXP77_00585 [Candidatus Aenigmatarchaeota archaeon]